MGLSNMTALTCLTLGSSHLYLDGHGMGMHWTTPWLESLTTLQWLRLEHVQIEPSQSHGLSQLACLTLLKVSFDPADLLGMLGQLTVSCSSCTSARTRVMSWASMMSSGQPRQQHMQA